MRLKDVRPSSAEPVKRRYRQLRSPKISLDQLSMLHWSPVHTGFGAAQGSYMLEQVRVIHGSGGGWDDEVDRRMMAPYWAAQGTGPLLRINTNSGPGTEVYIMNALNLRRHKNDYVLCKSLCFAIRVTLRCYATAVLCDTNRWTMPRRPSSRNWTLNLRQCQDLKARSAWTVCGMKLWSSVSTVLLVSGLAAVCQDVRLAVFLATPRSSLVSTHRPRKRRRCWRLCATTHSSAESRRVR